MGIHWLLGASAILLVIGIAFRARGASQMGRGDMRAVDAFRAAGGAFVAAIGALLLWVLFVIPWD